MRATYHVQTIRSSRVAFSAAWDRLSAIHGPLRQDTLSSTQYCLLRRNGETGRVRSVWTTSTRPSSWWMASVGWVESSSELFTPWHSGGGPSAKRLEQKRRAKLFLLPSTPTHHQLSSSLFARASTLATPHRTLFTPSLRVEPSPLFPTLRVTRTQSADPAQRAAHTHHHPTAAMSDDAMTSPPVDAPVVRL